MQSLPHCVSTMLENCVRMSKNTMWLSDFRSIDELKDWLLSWGILHPQQELDEMWQKQVEQSRIYKCVIYTHRKRHAPPKHDVRFFRRRPQCHDCGKRLPLESTPIKPWQPGKRSVFLCSECTIERQLQERFRNRGKGKGQSEIQGNKDDSFRK